MNSGYMKCPQQNNVHSLSLSP